MTMIRAFSGSLIVALSGIGSCFAGGICDKACPSDNTSEWVQCYDRNKADFDSKLNTFYNTLQRGLSKKSALKLRTAQQAWAPYRLGKCMAEASFEGGTLALVAEASCECATTQERMSELQAYVGTYLHGNVSQRKRSR